MEKHVNLSKTEDSPKKFWSRMTILKNRIIESGSFNQELLNKVINAKREPMNFDSTHVSPFIKPQSLNFSKCQK